MVEVDKVSVRVVRHSDGVPYHEYAPPSDSPEHGGSPNGRYIEVSTDERYHVEVKLLPGFKFLGYPRVRARTTLDNNTYTRTLSRDKPSDSKCKDPAHRHHRETVLSIVNRTIDGRRMRCGVTFGQLESGLYTHFPEMYCYLAAS
jgi:hypothetical protein